MTTSATDIRDRVPAVRIPHGSHSGLWAALVTQIDPSSAAGSRLVGLRPGQPFPASGDNGVAMFSRRTAVPQPRLVD